MKNIKIFIISGKAKAGKDTTAGFIKEYATAKGLKCINLQFSSYIKMYVKEISSWNGEELSKPRVLLQELGETIRNTIDKHFFINRIIEDIKVYSNYYDIITISDARLPEELDEIVKFFPQSKRFKIIRPNYNPYASIEERNHPTELALDNYTDYDEIIYNDGSLEDLKNKIDIILKNTI